MRRILLTVKLSILFCILVFIIPAFSQEDITITSYYPSPYGVYDELRADRMTVGSGYRTDILAGGELFVEGNVGIGTTIPSVGDQSLKLDVEGAVGAQWYCDEFGNNCTAAGAAVGLPAGAVSFFNLSSCPSGWSPLVNARGRYLVGLQSGGTLTASVGNALSNLENRAVGRHTHTVTGDVRYYGQLSCNWGGSSAQGRWTTSGSTGYEGSVPGTNAPYMQLLVCQKD